MSQKELIDPFGDPEVRASVPPIGFSLPARTGTVVFVGVVAVLVILRAICHG